MSTFVELWRSAVERNESRLCLGLDPDPSRIPGDDVAAWAHAIVESTADVVCAYKPNIAFYEALGTHGHDVLRRVIDAIPGDIPVIIDAKRGDVGHTDEAYARSLFDVLGAHAVTVAPYMGWDSIEPFVRRAERGVFIVTRTSNAGARDLQDLPVVSPSGGQEPLYLAVARLASRWNSHGNIGLVTGATYPAEIAQVRHAAPELPLLLPGVGAQAGDVAAAVRAADGPGGFLVNASRSIIFADASPAGPNSVRAAALRLRDEINTALEAVRT